MNNSQSFDSARVTDPRARQQAQRLGLQRLGFSDSSEIVQFVAAGKMPPFETKVLAHFLRSKNFDVRADLQPGEYHQGSGR